MVSLHGRRKRKKSQKRRAREPSAPNTERCLDAILPNGAINVAVEHVLEGDKVGDELAVDVGEDVARLELLVRRSLGDHLVDHQQACGTHPAKRRALTLDVQWACLSHDRVCPRTAHVGARAAHVRLNLRPQAQAARLVVGLVLEDGLKGAARHGQVLLDQLERALDAVQRDVKARGGLLLAA